MRPYAYKVKQYLGIVAFQERNTMRWTWNDAIKYRLAVKIADKVLEIVLAEQPELIARAVTELFVVGGKTDAKVQEEDNKPDEL